MRSMASVRAVAALAGAGGRRATQQARACVVASSFRRFLSSDGVKPPPNPFEIQLNLTEPVSTSETISLSDAKRAAGLQQAEAEKDIALLHDEMGKLFGGVAEHDEGSSASVEAAMEAETPTVMMGEGRMDPMKEEGVPVVKTKQVGKDVSEKTKEKKVVNERSVKKQENGTNAAKVTGRPLDVMLLLGPCSVMRNVWTGGNVPTVELYRKIEEQAEDLEVVVGKRIFQSEGAVLEALLRAKPDQVVVLCWNISLSKSPFVVHALELIKSRVIVVSPNIVDHGPLPSNVVGVVSGFGGDSISMALSGAAKLRPSDEEQSNAQAVITVNDRKKSSGKAVLTKQEDSQKATKKNAKCFNCGERGHLARNCPMLAKVDAVNA